MLATVAMVPMLMLVGCSTTSTTTAVTDVTTLPQGVEQAFPNAGPTADRSAVRDTVVAAVHAPALVKRDLVAIDYLTTQEEPLGRRRSRPGRFQQTFHADWTAATPSDVVG